MTPIARDIDVHEFEWDGIQLSVTYEADWLGSGAEGSRFATAHLTITAIRPERAELPMTETGFRSHFLGQGAVEEAGGPVAYVRAWLDHAAKSAEWRKRMVAARQLSLF